VEGAEYGKEQGEGKSERAEKGSGGLGEKRRERG